MEPHEERIAELRGQIDEIDRQLIELFERRMDVAREIGAVKREHNLAYATNAGKWKSRPTAGLTAETTCTGTTPSL